MSWSSKLQTEITLSTTESEYITLSTATRELLTLQQLLQDIANNSFISIPQLPPSDKKKRPIFIHLKFMRCISHSRNQFQTMHKAYIFEVASLPRSSLSRTYRSCKSLN